MSSLMKFIDQYLKNLFKAILSLNSWKGYPKLNKAFKIVYVCQRVPLSI